MFDFTSIAAQVAVANFFMIVATLVVGTRKTSLIHDKSVLWLALPLAAVMLTQVSTLPASALLIASSLANHVWLVILEKGELKEKAKITMQGDGLIFVAHVLFIGVLGWWMPGLALNHMATLFAVIIAAFAAANGLEGKSAWSLEKAVPAAIAAISIGLIVQF